MSGNNLGINTNANPAYSVDSTLDGSFTGAGLNEPVTEEQSKSWFEAMAKAWGKAMDDQAAVITKLSNEVSQGTNTQLGNDGSSDQPSSIVELQAQSLKFGFLSQSESTSVNAVGDGQQAMARKS